MSTEKDEFQILLDKTTKKLTKLKAKLQIEDLDEELFEPPEPMPSEKQAPGQKNANGWYSCPWVFNSGKRKGQICGKRCTRERCSAHFALGPRS